MIVLSVKTNFYLPIISNNELFKLPNKMDIDNNIMEIR